MAKGTMGRGGARKDIVHGIFFLEKKTFGSGSGHLYSESGL